VKGVEGIEDVWNIAAEACKVLQQFLKEVY